MARKKTVKKKIEIVFDPKNRKEFLTGFSKRKNERRKRAKEELERNMKEEHKRIKQEVKEGLKHLKKTFEPLRELTAEDRANEEEYEDDDVKVKIVELSTGELAAQRHLLGENRAADSEENSADEVSEPEEDRTVCVPGMDFDGTATRRRKRKRAAAKLSDESEDENVASTAKKAKSELQRQSMNGLTSKKELNRLMKNKTLKKLKQSQIFKQKERCEKKVNQKKARRDKNNTLKSLPKNQRMKKKFEPSKYRKGRMVNKKQMRKKPRS